MNFADILQQFRIDFHPEGTQGARPGWIDLECPFCAPGTGKFYLGYNITGNYITCWTCGYHTLAEYLHEKAGISFREIRALLGDMERPERVERAPRTGRLKIPSGVGPLLPAHIKYLRDVRGFNVEKISRLWDIQGIGIHDSLPWRVFIPVKLRGEMVSWTTRAIGERASPKYRSADLKDESVSIKRVMYGSDYVRYAASIHEGPLDVWAVGPGATATCGTGFSMAQVLIMSRFPVRIVAFDSEPAAQERAAELCDHLEGFPGRTLNIQLDAKDAADAALNKPREIRALRRLLERG